MGSQSQTDSSQLTSLIKSFGEAVDTKEKQGYLASLTTQVLPVLSLVEVETKLFSRVLPKVYDAVSDAISKIGHILQSVSPNTKRTDSLHAVQSLLQSIMSYMECLENYVAHVMQLSLADDNELSIGQVRSLPSAIIQTVKATFKHCKESEHIYGDFFQLVSQDLAMLFKRTYQLQKALMELLDKVQLNYDTTDQDIQDITDVCHQLLDVCILIGDLDTSILVNTWKVLKKLVTKHKDYIKDHLEVERLICHLCSSIESKLCLCIQLTSCGLNGSDDAHKGSLSTGDEAALAKMLKVMRFLVGHLVHLIKEYDGYYDKCIEDIFHFLLTIQSKLPPSPNSQKITTSAAQGLKSALLVVVEPLLSVLVANKIFANLVTKKTLAVKKEDQFSYCCLVASLVGIASKTTEDVFTYWVMPSNYPEEEHRLSLVEVLFKTFKMCVLENYLPVFLDGVMCNGKPLREVTFYEHVCTRICALVAATPVTCFPVVERCLLEKILEDDVLCALLAIDVWCFMARWGSAELCAGHVTVLTQLLLTLPSSEAAYIHLSLLIQRLVRLMAVEHQEGLLTSFPPSKEENIIVWRVFPLQDMPEVVKKKVCRLLVPLCIKVCHSRTKQSDEHDDILFRCLSCLHAVYNLSEVEQYVPPVHHSAIVGLVNDLWCDNVTETGVRFDSKVWCVLLDLSSTLLHVIQPEDFAKIISGLQTLLAKCSEMEVRDAAVHFLGKCGRKEIPEHLKSTVLGNITAMFSSLVSDQHWLVHHRAFQSVKAFAEVTHYTHVMGDCVPESLLPALSDFLNELPYRHTEFPGDTEFVQGFFKLQLEKAEARERQISGDETLNEEISMMDKGSRSRDKRAGDCGAPEAKRVKLHQNSCENKGEELYEKALKEMNISLSSISDLRKEFAPPPRIVEQLKEIQRRLQGFLSKSPNDET
ncbi:FIGNL1-interacting regulator of recombination and mitosis-like isoform X1 [Montipora foliosa]|uniref:FIGNL1-interacting regulator of recombination and mitosis-like isoform X1 n=1 Tax=Montipora foliosa TaxID=591990 RepID=UPI0035F1699F